jgi:hypothetical protein
MAAYVDAVGSILRHVGDLPEDYTPDDVAAIVDTLPCPATRIVMTTAAVRMRSTRRYWEVMRDSFPEEYVFAVEEAITVTAIDIGALGAIDHPTSTLPAELPDSLWGAEIRPDVAAYPAGTVILPFGPPRAGPGRRPCPVLKMRCDEGDALLNFRNMTKELLDGVMCPGSPFVVCGGMVLQSIRTDMHHQASDVDVFMVGIKTAQDATNALDNAIRKISQNFKKRFPAAAHVPGGRPVDHRQMLLLTRNALTIVDMVSDVKIQFILRLYENVTQILHRFDLGACMLAFDGFKFRATPRGVYALRRGVNLADPMNLTHASRGAKYTDRGFAYVVPTWGECMDVAKAFSGNIVFRITDGPLDDAIKEGGLQQAIAWPAVSNKMMSEGYMESNALYEYLQRPHLLMLDRERLDDFRKKFGYRFPVEFVDPEGMPPVMYGELMNGNRWMVSQPAERTSTGPATAFYNLPGAQAS